MLTKFDEYSLKNKLSPPFTGVWKALNAARSATNPHFANPNQRFAVDWVKVDANNNTYKGEGKQLEDYYCYGEDVLAVADGIVVIVVDGVLEHTPFGIRDRYNVPGNHVVLDLGQGEFAFYAHMIPGHMKVKVGDCVYGGRPLARVGNSGNSSEPHLHFQIMDRARLIEAASMPIRYSDIILNGKLTASAQISEGDLISAATLRR